jgi:hypothetical protein
VTQENAYQQLAATIGVGDSALVPKIIEVLADENEAKVLLASSPPATANELASKTGLSAEDVDQMTDALFKKGLLFKSKKPDAMRYYRFRNLLQFHDATILAPDVPESFYDLWREYHKTEFKEHHKRIESALSKSVVRVIPVNIALEPETRIAPFEDIKKIVGEARKLAVTKCTCRVIDGCVHSGRQGGRLCHGTRHGKRAQ